LLSGHCDKRRKAFVTASTTGQAAFNTGAPTGRHREMRRDIAGARGQQRRDRGDDPKVSDAFA
jgi:hypothetical protein